MFLFVVYALGAWYLAFRWRRRVIGVLSIAIGLGLLAFFNLIHYRVAAVVGYESLLPAFRVLMYPYMAFVGGLALYLFSFPREVRPGAVQCRSCWYDFESLVAEYGDDTRCPECGTTVAEGRTRRGRRLARQRRDAMASLPVVSGAYTSVLAADQANGHAEQQDQRGQPAHE